MIIVPTEKRFDWQHAPVALFFIVLANCLIFFLYQSGDNVKLFQAIESYERHGFFELEWPLYEEYLLARDDTATLEQYRTLNAQDERGFVAFNLLGDADFYEFLKERRYDFLSYQRVEEWTVQREKIHQTIQDISYLRYGLIPDRRNIFNFLSHQFLHGDAMHLLGNMFFLIICGFAVEAAIGHLRFLVFYLVSGVAGGVLFCLVEPSGSTPLVGASGAISGVMAMYVAAFRLRMIEFFYWFFVFVGYVRAPALLILPFYIGKELYDFYTNTGSNVAYMAHVGGFLGGALLIGGALILNPKIFNQEYLEEDQSVDPAREKLANVYAQMERFRFKAALKALNALIEEHGATHELEALRYHLMKPNRPRGYIRCVLAILKSRPGNARDLALLNEVWNDNPELRASLDDDTRLKLALNLTTPEYWAAADAIFQELHHSQCRHMSLGVLARKLSVCFEKLGNRTKQHEYAQIADSLLASGAIR